MMGVPRDHEEPLGFFDFIGRRRRVVSDRTWFGLAFVVASFALPGWWRLLLLIPGALLAAAGLHRAWIRRDETTSEPRPGPPW
jgi:hypothetical protein